MKITEQQGQAYFNKMKKCIDNIRERTKQGDIPKATFNEILLLRYIQEILCTLKQ
jgi:hypothetical protein